MREVVTKVYQFGELNDKAKERAREWYRKGIECSDNLVEMFRQYVEEASYPTNKIEFSLGYCQGDGVAFYGDISGERLCLIASRLYGKRSKELTRVVAIVNNLTASIERNSFGYHYSHFNTMSVNISWHHYWNHLCKYELKPGQRRLFTDDDEHDKFVAKLEADIRADIRALSIRLEALGYEEIEYQHSAEQVDSALIDMEYEFTEDGERA